MLKHCAENASEHANDARKESRDASKELTGWSMVSNAGNLAANHESVAVFGGTERNNHRKMHHRQSLQSLHDLFQLDMLKHHQEG